MSYILEALRRAETERERRRRVPGLHAQPVPVVAADESRPPRSKAWLWVVTGVSAGVLLPLLWRSWPDGAAPDEAASPRVAVAGSVAADAPGAATPPTPTPPQPAQPPAGDAATAPPPPAAKPAPATPRPAQPRASAARPAGGRNAAQPAARPPATVATAQPAPPRAAPVEGARPAPGESARPAPGAAAPPASAPEPRLRSLAEMPEDVRRGVPALSFGGSVYSDIAAQRMVILNGQVLREGDAVTDELQLEQIRPRSAVMRLRGQRFEIGF